MISERAIRTRAGAAEAEGAHRSPIFELDESDFKASFNRRPYLFQHRIAGHPLFNLPRLIELARGLPRELIDYNAGDIPVSIDPRLTPANGLSVEETIRRIEECNSWMVIKRVERDLEYKELMDFCLDEIRGLSEQVEPGTFERAGSIFIASPGSVTPYHLDHETNFLLQIRGSKTVYTFDKGDPSVLPPQQLEEYYGSTTLYRNLVFKEEFQEKSRPFELTPGSVIHIPSTAPHWVKNGDGVSISFSAAFQTKTTDRIRNIHRFNALLRNRGGEPAPVGQSAVRDAIKDLGFRAFRRGRALLIGEPEPVVERYF